MNEKSMPPPTPADIQAAYEHGRWLRTQTTDSTDRMLADLAFEVERLRVWKESALALERELNAQTIAKLLGVPLGQSCHEGIGERVPLLVEERERLRTEVAKFTGAFTPNGALARENESLRAEVDQWKFVAKVCNERLVALGCEQNAEGGWSNTRAEKVEATCAELVTDGNAITLAASLAQKSLDLTAERENVCALVDLNADLLAALQHMQVCRSCGEEGWSSCEGGRAAEAAIEKAQALAATASEQPKTEGAT